MSTSKENQFLRILLQTFKEDAERRFLLNNDHNETTAYTATTSSTIEDSAEQEDIPSFYAPADTLRSTSNIYQRPPARGGVCDPFPSKLHSLLESRKYEHIISWQPHGRCFLLKDQKGFVEQVMPLYFKQQTKFASFQRQLNLYGFNRIYRAGPDKGGYYHELFLRGHPKLTFKMIRTKVKGCSKKPNNPLMEPNFYRMPFVPWDHSLLDCPDQQVFCCHQLPNHGDDHMKNQCMQNLPSPRSTITSLEDFFSLCESKHQEEENTRSVLINEITALIEQQEDGEIGVLAGNHFTGVNEDDHHVSDTSSTSNHFHQMPFVSHEPSRLDHSDQQGLCTSLPGNVNDYMNNQWMHSLLSPSTGSTSIEDFLLCEPKHQGREGNETKHSGGTSMTKEITAMVREQEDMERGVFAGNHFYFLK